jgi:hypothetical protein
MISIIICSTQPEISQQLANNIEQTIGMDYELIIIPNQNNSYSIFEAYNIGLKQSKFNICCFMHQDILFHTTSWGQNVLKHFENKSIGLIGIAGTKFLGRTPAFWSDYSENNVINIIQSDNSGRVPTEKMYSDITYTNGTTKVVVADGVWFCLDKTRTNTIQFDTKYSGFHFYDHDICMQVHSTGKEIHVINDIIIEHFSWGAISHSWANNAFLFYKKWQSHLPLNLSDSKVFEFDEKETFIKLIKIVDYYRCYQHIFSLLKYGFNLLNKGSLKIMYRYKKVFLRGIAFKLNNK